MDNWTALRQWLESELMALSKSYGDTREAFARSRFDARCFQIERTLRRIDSFNATRLAPPLIHLRGTRHTGWPSEHAHQNHPAG